MRQRVGNYRRHRGNQERTAVLSRASFHLIDLPGTYSLAARSPTKWSPSISSSPASGEPRPTSFSRLSMLEPGSQSLSDTQALELGVPVVVALNMIDVAEAQGSASTLRN